MPLELRRKQLMANYWVNLKGHRANHPTREVLQDSWENEKSASEHFAKVGNKIAKELSIEGLQISPPVVYPEEAPWRLVCPRVDMSLLEIKRTGKKTVDLLSAFSYLISQEYQDFVQVYTDGAKNPDTGATGFGVAVPGKGVGIYRRTGDGLGMYTVEMVAVLVALKWVEITAQKKTVICSDSASVLESFTSFHSNSRQDILYQVLHTFTRIHRKGGQVTFFWVPAHVGLQGNERADKLAKRALKANRVEMQVSISKAEVKSVIKEKIYKKWQSMWDRESRGRHLYQIQQNVRTARVAGKGRREEIVMTRLRIGHSALNKMLKLIGKHNTGLCEECQEEESVEHVIMRCRRYETQREKMRKGLVEAGVKELSLKGLLDMSDRSQQRMLLEFLRSTGLLNRI